MSSSRSKRKRAEADTPAIAAPAASRRRTREQRESGNEPNEQIGSKNDETENNSDPVPSEANIGESSVPPAENNENTLASEQAIPANATGPDSAAGPAAPATLKDTKDEKSQDNNSNSPSHVTATKQGDPTKSSTPSTDALNEGNSMATQTNASEKGTSDRANQIRSMISHRKLLLERVRQGRSSARHRVSDLAKSETKSTKVSESSGGNTTASTEVTEKMKDEEEIASFKRLSRSALQAAKKQRVEKDEMGEKRTVALRRGASVGKKMNAALSSLAPGHGSSSIPPYIAATQPLHLSSAGDSTSMIPGPPEPLASQRPATTSNVRQVVQQPASLTAGKRMKSATQMSKSTSQSSLKAPVATLGDPKGARSGGQKSSKAVSAVGGSRAMPPAPTTTNPGALPLHAGIPTSGLPPNRLALPPVVCPEAVALRERRNTIRSNLVKHLKERQQCLEKSHGTQSLSALGVQPVTENAISPFPSHSSTKGRGPASYLPRRRKTHWDNLLEEMRWMATDFIEERKWKVSAARTIGSAVLIPGISAATAMTSVVETEQKDEAFSEKATGNKTSKSSSPEKKSAASARAHVSRAYATPSSEDNTASRRVAKVISSMAYELGSATIDAGALAQSDRVHMKALKRHLGVRKELQMAKDDDVEEATEKDEADTLTQASKNTSVSQGGTNVGPEESESKRREGSFERISKEVESLLEPPKKTVRKSSKRKADTGRKSDAEDVSLTSSQLEAIDFIEKKWTSSSKPGAIFTGPKSSGKTTALCSLLWKYRAKGPQVLVCSPARVMKWVHELYRFKGIQIRYLGLSGGISSPLSDIEGRVSFDPNEIVVCEFSEFEGIAQSDFTSFQTILIDCRYPRGFLGSRLPSKEAKGSKPNEDTPGISQFATIPAELTTESWWEIVTESVAKTSINRLLVENPGPEMFFTCLAHKSQIQQLEIIALRAAFVMGPQIFASSTSSVKKRILTWARRKTKGLFQSTSNRLEAVRKFLIEGVHPFYCEAKSDGILEEASHMPGKRLEYELRMCDMSPEERSEYEKCCAALRGALSFRIDEATDVSEKNLNAISNALLRLRRQCIHSRMSHLFCGTPMRARLMSYPAPGKEKTDDSRILSRKVNDNASQTDLDLASSILDGSAKFRELVSILRDECGYRIEGEEQLKSVLTPENTKRGKNANERKTAKKVAILAVLPEVQILVSVLLNSIGITHELLLRPSRVFSPSQNEISPTLPEMQTNAATLSWIECQQALSRFNSFPAGKNSAKPSLVSNMIVTSPDIVAGDHGGIGIDAADFVITLDEDWSGRGELLMRSMMAGLILRNMRAKDRGCQILRLVCEDTCEEVFLSADSDVDSKQNVESEAETWPWRFDPCGRFLVADPTTLMKDGGAKNWPLRKSNDEMFSFPGINLFRLRNKSLSEVLATESNLPPLLGSGSLTMFLPKTEDASSKDEKTFELCLLVNLMEKEEKSHRCLKAVGIMNENISSFHPAAFTRQDLNVIAVRIYLEQFGRSLVLKHLAAGSEPIPSAVPADVILATPADTATADLDGSSNRVDSWNTGGPVCKADEFASSLLFYSTSTSSESSGSQPPEAGNRKQKQISKSRLNGLMPRRVNSYVTNYEELKGFVLRDGHQGSESLIYFPPLFPGMLQCFTQAKHDIEAIRARNATAEVAVQYIGSSTDATVPRGIKRSAGYLESADAKRSKTENSIPNAQPYSEQATFTTAPRTETNLTVDEQAMGPGVVSEDEASHRDAATFLLGLHEDFGIAGLGAIPLPKDSAVASSNAFVEVSNCMLDPDHLFTESSLLSNFIASDTEELESFRYSTSSGLFLDSVVLFVARKKQRPFVPLPGATAPLYRPSQGLPGADAPWATIPSNLPSSVQGGGNGVLHDINGSANSSKKSKKKGVPPLGSPPAFGRLPGGDITSNAHNPPINMQTAKAKDMYRNKILSFLTARQKAMGMTLFESPAYRVAAIRFRNRANDRMPRHCWTSSTAWKVGPGLPLLLAKDANFSEYSHADLTLWTSIVKGLKDENSSTGDDAIALATSQRSALRRSLNAPCRVDFGPFSSGFLAAPSGMTGVSPPRSRTGVNLPMGVKVPLIHGQQQSPWTEEEDKELHTFVVRFDMNWILTSRALSGLDDVGNTSNAGHRNHRSPRQCRERWQVLARSDPSLPTEVRKAESELRDSAFLKTSGILDGDGSARRFYSPVLATRQVFPKDAGETKDGNLNQSASCFVFPPEKASGLVPGKDRDPTVEAADGNSKMDVDPVTKEVDSGVRDKMDIDSPSKQPRKSFSSLLAAKAKTQSIPMTIPGVAPGSQASFSAAHPSHSQTVQSSVSSSWTNGKTEMWPLQFLDVAEKQRAASTAAAAIPPAPAPAPPSSTSRTLAASSSASRPQSSAPSSGASANRSTQKPSGSRSAVSTKSRTPPHPQKSPPPATPAYYHPYPHPPHPGSVPSPGSHPYPAQHQHQHRHHQYQHPHPQHQHPHHQHPQHQRAPPPASPAARPPNAAAHAKYVAHTPVSHSQQLQAESAKRKTPPSRTASNKVPTPAPPPATTTAQTRPPASSGKPTPSPAPAPSPQAPPPK